MKFRLLKVYLLSVIIGYVILRLISIPLANFSLAAAIVITIPYMIYRLTFRNSYYKNSIRNIDKKFVAGNNTIANDYCTVIYTPDKTISVFEITKSKRRDKRMFTLTKQQLNINKAWYRICRVFDYYTNIDLLKEFFDNETKVLVITLENKSAHIEDAPEPQPQPKIKDGFVEMNTINPDSFGADFGKQNKEEGAFVSMNALNEQAPSVQRVEKEPELTGINDIMNKFGKKINVNKVEAGELAILPGINIVTAKKIIEYRNLNGEFKTADDFIKAANVKEHFIPKIKEMIEIKKSSDNNSDNGDSNSGRIVDF